MKYDGKFASRWRAKSPDALCAILPLFFLNGILPCNTAFRCKIEQIQNRRKQPFQWLHQQIHQIRPKRCSDFLRKRIAVIIVEMPYQPVQTRQTFLKQFLKGIRHGKLSVYHDHGTTAIPQPKRTHQFPVSAGGNCTEIVSLIFQRRRRKLL